MTSQNDFDDTMESFQSLMFLKAQLALKDSAYER